MSDPTIGWKCSVCDAIASYYRDRDDRETVYLCRACHTWAKLSVHARIGGSHRLLQWQLCRQIRVRPVQSSPSHLAPRCR